MQTSGFVALLGAVILSRFVHERGFRRLSEDEKIRLIDGSSASRTYAMIPLFVLIVAYWLLVTRTQIDKTLLTVGYFALLVVYLVARALLNWRKLVQLGLPFDYLRTFTIAQIISFIGIAWFFFAMFYEV
jgi:hypothetical protein